MMVWFFLPCLMSGPKIPNSYSWIQTSRHQRVSYDSGRRLYQYNKGDFQFIFDLYQPVKKHDYT